MKNGSNNGVQKCFKWSPWRPKGGQRAAKGRLCHTPWSILRCPKIGRFLKGPWGAKSRWMLALGRQRGAKNATTLGQALGRGVLFAKMAPGARLARAFIINKYITYRGGCSNTPWAYRPGEFIIHS